MTIDWYVSENYDFYTFHNVIRTQDNRLIKNDKMIHNCAISINIEDFCKRKFCD